MLIVGCVARRLVRPASQWGIMVAMWAFVRRVGKRSALAAALLTLLAAIAYPTGSRALAAGSTPVRGGATRATTAPTAKATPQVRRHDVLVLAGNGTAYDLDSLALNWDSSIGTAWTVQDIEYIPDYTKHIPALAIANEPTTDVRMGKRKNLSYQDCANAKYDPSYSSSNPNNLAGAAIGVGQAICVITQDTKGPHGKPLKSDGGHYALLVVTARTASALTLAVTVWQRPGEAPELHVSGNELVNGAGEPVVLHGVDRSGGEWACIHGTGIWSGPMDQAAIDAMKAWDINAVRVPLNEACWNGESYVKRADRGPAYRSAVERYIQLLNSNGLVAILDLAFTDGTYKGPSSACATAHAGCEKPMPDKAQAIPFWNSVAHAFREDDSVVFDLFNEPFPQAATGSETGGWACWRGGGASCPGIPYAVAGMQSLVDVVRSMDADNVIMLGGIGWANDLSQLLDYLPTDPEHNLAASWHSYSFDPCHTLSCWNAQVAPVQARIPVIAGEIGEGDCADSYIDPLMKWLDTRHVSYLAWSWNANFSCAAGPSLIASYAGTPTRYGAGYRAHLRSLR